MSNIKHFILNGHKYFTKSDLTIFELINYFNYNTSLLVLEYNNLICTKTNWDKIIIKNNDRIEIVTIVGGG
jgi:sulfur carrier protein